MKSAARQGRFGDPKTSDLRLPRVTEDKCRRVAGRRLRPRSLRLALIVVSAAMTSSFTFGHAVALSTPGLPGQVSTSSTAPSGDPLLPFLSDSGLISLSVDAVGTNDPAGKPISVHKNAGATVRKAFLFAASTGFSGYTPVDGDITLNGTPVTWDPANTISNDIFSVNVESDVTSIVKPIVDAAPAGDVDLTAAEGSTTGLIDGEILAVILNDPTVTQPGSVTLLYGAQKTSGDTFHVALADPVDKSNPNFGLNLSLGISFGFQPAGQFSTVDVNGTRMTSSAGGQDDGEPANGALITAGGVGDLNDDPPDPNATDSTCTNQFGQPAPRCDDELYSLLPFVNNGDTSLTFNTTNPSTDDNIFFAALDVRSGAALVGAGVVLSPSSATNNVGQSHTLTATVQDDNGNPIQGVTVHFQVTLGPNVGTSGDAVSDASGKAQFTYTSSTAGTDHIGASFTDAQGTHTSNEATKTWEAVSRKPTSTTYTGGSSVQYSDPVALSGTLLDTSVSPNVGIAGKQLDFTLGTQAASASPTDASGNASTSLVVTQKPGSVTTVGTSFAGDSSYLPSSDSDPFAITKEDCTLAYSGDTLVPPATMTNLAADMGEPDASLGDRSNKSVTFTVVDAALNTQTFATTTDASGHASISAALADGVYGVSVSFAGDDFYLPCATTTDTLVTVETAAAKVTGGGWIAIGTGRTSFGFNAIPIAGGGFKGQFQLRSNNGKSRFHGNVVSSLSGSGNSATWSGTGSWNGQTGYSYTIGVVDNGSSGSKKGDTIDITITSPSNVVVYTTGGPQALKGGNITVH